MHCLVDGYYIVFEESETLLFNVCYVFKDYIWEINVSIPEVYQFITRTFEHQSNVKIHPFGGRLVIEDEQQSIIANRVNDSLWFLNNIDLIDDVVECHRPESRSVYEAFVKCVDSKKMNLRTHNNICRLINSGEWS